MKSLPRAARPKRHVHGSTAAGLGRHLTSGSGRTVTRRPTRENAANAPWGRRPGHRAPGTPGGYRTSSGSDQDTSALHLTHGCVHCMEHAYTYYLAGSFVHRARLRDIRRQIAERHPDCRCRARWLDFDDEMERNPELVAAMDAHDALTSDAMVFVRGGFRAHRGSTPSSVLRSRTGSRCTSSPRRGSIPGRRSRGSSSSSWRRA